MVFSIPILSSNGFSILTLRQAQGERIEKHGFDTLPSSSSGQAGRTDWKGALRQAFFRTVQANRLERRIRKPKEIKMA
jgi:hypothetical protein